MGGNYVSFVSGFWVLLSGQACLSSTVYRIMWRVLIYRRKHAPDKFLFSVLNVWYKCCNTKL